MTPETEKRLAEIRKIRNNDLRRIILCNGAEVSHYGPMLDDLISIIDDLRAENERLKNPGQIPA